MSASNTKDCFREFVGHRIKGVLFDALPWNRVDLSAGSKALIFEDGRALVIHLNGTYYIATVEEVQRAIRSSKTLLETNERQLKEVLKLAGEDV